MFAKQIILKSRQINSMTNNLMQSKNFFYRINRKFMNEFETSKDYYKILNIDSKSSEKQIKEAYHKLAKKYHPDLNGGKTSDSFKEMTSAYDILSDPAKRKQYDEYRGMFSSTNNYYSGPNHENSYKDANSSQAYKSSSNFQDNFNKSYTKAKTTYSYRDPKTGEFKTYTYEGDSQGNPFFKDFEDFMKKFNNMNEASNKNKDRYGNHEYKYEKMNSYENYNRNNFSDPYSEYRQDKFSSGRDPRYNWQPNWHDYEYINYLYAKKMFTYVCVGFLLLFSFSFFNRRRYIYIEDHNVHPYVTLTPYPPNDQVYNGYNSNYNRVMPPSFNNISENSDPYKSNVIPKIK